MSDPHYDAMEAAWLAADEIATLRGAMTAKEADYDRLRAENDALKLRVGVLEKALAERGACARLLEDTLRGVIANGRDTLNRIGGAVSP